MDKSNIWSFYIKQKINRIGLFYYQNIFESRHRIKETKYEIIKMKKITITCYVDETKKQMLSNLLTENAVQPCIPVSLEAQWECLRDFRRFIDFNLFLTYPSSSSASMSRLAKNAILGKWRSWCSTNTRTGNRFGAHEWLMNRAIFP